MAVGAIKDERGLEAWTRQLLDRLGISPIDVNVDTGSVRLKLRAGVWNLGFAAGAAVSTVDTVPHNMGPTVPLGVLALPNGPGGPSAVGLRADNIDADSFDLYGEFRTGTWAAGGTIPVFWLAVGII